MGAPLGEMGGALEARALALHAPGAPPEERGAPLEARALAPHAPGAALAERVAPLAEMGTPLEEMWATPI